MMLSGFKTYPIVALLLAASLLTLTQCKRSEEPFNNIGTPVFALKGTVNGQPFNKVAGVDSYYMYSAFVYDSANQAYSFSGRLAIANCTTCKESMQVILYDKTTNNGTSPVDIAAALQAGNYSYYFPQVVQQVRYKYEFKSELEFYNSPTYFWTFGGADSSSLPNPVVYFTDTATKNVCLKVTDGVNFCTKTICNPITIPKIATTNYIRPNFLYDTTATDTIQFYNISSTPASAIYHWDFGDGNQLTDSTPRHMYSAPGRYKVTLTMTVPSLGSQVISKYIRYRDSTQECLANYTFSSPVTDTVTINPSVLSKVVIRYIDANGELFVSNSQPQPFPSQFTIISNNAYNNNELGQKTRSLTVNFRCRVFSTTTTAFKDLVINEGVIAVAYPD